MQDFFTWGMLATYAGAMLATTLLTQFLKELRFLQRIPTRLLSYALAFIVLLLAAVFTKTFSAGNAVLSLFNAAVVALASNGAFDAMTQRKNRVRSRGKKQGTKG